MRLVASLALAVAAVAVLDACGSARDVEQSNVSGDCTACHALSLGPPLEVGGQLVTVHEFHIDRGVQCSTCHPGYSADPPGATNSATHWNGMVEASVEAGAITKAATFSNETPTWPGSCLDCHTSLPSL